MGIVLSPAIAPGLTGLGGSWFLAEQLDFYEEAVVSDALAQDPDTFFGPAAWNGGYGPFASRNILRVTMAGYVEWNEKRRTTLARGGIDPGPASPWPGVISVCKYGEALGLGHLDGVKVADRAALVELLEPYAPQGGESSVELSPAARQASLISDFPYIASLSQ